MLETLRSYWSIISTIITVVAIPAVGYLYKKYKQADARQKAVELGVQALLRCLEPGLELFVFLGQFLQGTLALMLCLEACVVIVNSHYSKAPPMLEI